MSAIELIKEIAYLKHQIERQTAQAKRQAVRVGKVDRIRIMHKAGK